MLIPTIIMAVVAVVVLIIAYQRGSGEHIQGIRAAGNLLLQVLPLLIFAFIIAGILPLLIPTEMVSKWVGSESGIRGILIGSAMGGIMPGGPFVSLPIAAGLLHAGANIGTMVAFMTGWSIWAITRLPLEVGMMGWKFTAIRLASTIVFPILAGLIANLFFSRVDVR